MDNNVGDIQYSHDSNRDRSAHIIAAGSNADEALDMATAAANAVECVWIDAARQAEYAHPPHVAHLIAAPRVPSRTGRVR
ncbi:hypothetical protein ACIQGZ_22670 [Streptomyces sp. NPDC092296]|uniref:hypothetical protein n=1 Tax=Streptomyces sp. NPDC092296 TaxID=3366012 RepID=UPI003812197B